MTVMLVVDLSASERFGTRRAAKARVASEVAALLAFSAIRNNDRVGLILATDKVERIVPPKKGEKHVMRVVREILGFEPKWSEGAGARVRRQGAACASARRPTSRRRSSRSCACRGGGASRSSSATSSTRGTSARSRSRRPSTTSSRWCSSIARDAQLPDVGLATFEDLESGESVVVDTGDPAVRAWYAAAMKKLAEARRAALQQARARRGGDRDRRLLRAPAARSLRAPRQEDPAMRRAIVRARGVARRPR